MTLSLPISTGTFLCSDTIGFKGFFGRSMGTQVSSQIYYLSSTNAQALFYPLIAYVLKAFLGTGVSHRFITFSLTNAQALFSNLRP